MTKARVPGILALSLFAIPLGFAQTAAADLKFEVASVKVAPEGRNGVRGGCRGIDSVYTPAQQAEAPPLGRCVITDARLSHLMGIAYGVSMINLQTGPDWIQRGDLRFNVEAKAEDPAKTTEKDLRTMLQNLLVERFQLKFHNESSETSGFALSIAKNGPKLRASQASDMTLAFTGPKGEELGKPAPGIPLVMKAKKCTVVMLMNILSALGHGPGVDKTGLTGEYDFTLTWDDNGGPDLSTALREQLGLRIDTVKVPTTTVVVDSAQKPDAN
ncbi:MAG TPA: TIGR03435 family protein [Bryobacteraceae bacterium]|jgi:uncharacterized protein (TIGR03435 family)